MEDAQQFNINLESPLDVHHSDMLVSVEQPTFLHNRQKYQGKLMPSSLRYEHDGWAAGWDVYQFKFNSATIPTVPEGYTVRRYLISDAKNQYILAIVDPDNKEVAQIYYNASSLIFGSSGEMPEIKDIESFAEISGIFNNREYVLRATIDNVEVDGEGFSASIETNNSGESVIVVTDELNSLRVDIPDFIAGTDIVNSEGSTIAVYSSYKDKIHTWTSEKYTITFNEDTQELLINNEQPEELEISGAELRFKFNATPTANINATFQTDYYYAALTDLKSEAMMNGIAGGTLPLSMYKVYQPDINYLHSGNKSTFEGYVPVWRGAYVSVAPNGSGANFTVHCYEHNNESACSVSIGPIETHSSGGIITRYRQVATIVPSVNTWLYGITITATYYFETDRLEMNISGTPVLGEIIHSNVYNSNRKAVLSQAIRGYFGIDMTMTDRLKEENASTNIQFRKSVGYDPSKLYIDRTGGSNRQIITLNPETDITLLLNEFSYAQLEFSSDSSFFVESSTSATYYAPGHIISGNIKSINSTEGNMNSVELLIPIKISFMTVRIDYATDANVFWSNIESGHKVLDTLQSWANQGIVVTVENPVINITDMTMSAKQSIKFVTGEINGEFLINCMDKSMQLNASDITIYDSLVEVKENSLNLVGASVVDVIPHITYECTGSRCFTASNLISYENGSVVIEQNGKQFIVNLWQLTALYNEQRFPITYENGKYIIKFNADETITLNLVVRGIFKYFNLTAVAFEPGYIKFILNETEYTIDLNALFDERHEDTMDFYYTDTRDEDVKEVLFAKRKVSSEFQFLKQQWDTTVATENFWWIDSNHILCLTKTEFQLKRKLDTLHDWDGDNWEIIDTWHRDDVLESGTYAFGATSSYNGGVVYVYRVHIDGNYLCVTFYNPMDLMNSVTMRIEKCKRSFGSVLNPVGVLALNTYSDILLSSLASMSHYSATSLGDGNIVFGIHFDKNYNQWGVVFSPETGIKSIIQGYGYVGVNGTLTGGELPVNWFDVSRGFTGAVEDIRIFSKNLYSQSVNTEIGNISELYNFTSRVVGNDCQQWYVSKNITGIVSHLNYVNGKYEACELPLNNNYDAIYASPSVSTRTMSDYLPTIKSFADLFPMGDTVSSGALHAALQVLLSICGYPLVYIYQCRFNTLIYLQQTIGQYAYVHYNNTVKPVVDTMEHNDSFDMDKTAGGVGKSNYDYTQEAFVKPTRADEISFDVQTIKQHASVENNPWSILPALIMQFAVSAVEWSLEKLKINQSINQSDTSEEGRKFTQVLSHNIDLLSVADMVVKSATPTVNSGVTAVKTLDMFYSTSDKQHVNAGPGYVSHAFVAQCVAQSVTSCQLELSQISGMYLIKALTLFQIRQEAILMQKAAELMYKLAQHIQDINPPFAMGSSTGDMIFKFMSSALSAAGNLLEKEAKLLLIVEEKLDTILTAMGGDKLTTSVTATASKHTCDMEGKHKYGSKSECFMYPCFDCEANTNINDEYVSAAVHDIAWNLDIPISSTKPFNIPVNVTLNDKSLPFVTNKPSTSARLHWYGDLPYYVANCRGNHYVKALPKDTAYVIGVESFLPKELFRNENIGEGDPVFSVPVIQDYVIDKSWQLGQTCIGEDSVFWVSCKDTKLIDCPPSNIVITPEFCGVACSYTAIEIKHGITRKYLRPWAVTPQALALNNTGFNSCYEEKAYHAFDGYGYRLVNWIGAPGMNKEHLAWQYSYLINDRFKRSNKMDCNQFAGNFKSEPIVAIKGDVNDKVFSMVTQPTESIGLASGTAEEDKDVIRYALPVFSEFVSTLPAVVKTLSSYQLAVVEGITGLISDLRNGQSAYKVPVSVDFSIGKNIYRMTSEYICSVTNQDGLVILQELVPVLGLTFLGATPYEAYLYSQATRQYYRFTGGTSLSVINMVERFRDVVCGRYDFVNQEVVMPCLATFERLDKEVKDDENETDNVIIPRIKDASFAGEVSPPIETIYNTRSWYRTLSLPCGVTYQGPNRCIINRFIFSDYMKKSILWNYGNWKRVPREIYHPFRKYLANYEQVDIDIGDDVKVKGWTHNPFLLVTSPIGMKSEVDCLYEWDITFAWSVEMDKLYGIDNYATVNIAAETMTPGGKVVTRPTHVFLFKELFTRTGNYGYYSFRYQSKGGIGNRERLHIWSDQYIAISSLQCSLKPVTSKRTEILTQQQDVQRLDEI